MNHRNGDFPLTDFINMFSLEVSPSQGEVRNARKKRVTQQLLCSKSHDFLAIFDLAHSKINQIA